MNYEMFRQALDDKNRRREYLFRDGRPYFVLISQQFSRGDLEELCDTATAIRRLDRHRDGRGFLRGVLNGYRVMHLFSQPSTRTAESFMAAADKLGATSRSVSDIRTSSLMKGESVEDSVRTLSSFFDMIVTRHHESEFAVRASYALFRSGRPIPLISAGSGHSQHVTQSLLDIYTLRYSFAQRGGIDGKTILIVGDIARNRAARSLAYLLTKFRIRAIHFVSSKAHYPDDDLLNYIRRHDIGVHTHEALGPVLRDHGESLDAMYITRLQQEWDAHTPGERKLGTADEYVLNAEYRSLIRDDCVIMHPLPRVNELPDDWSDHPGFMVWRQVRNGMWIRAALFATIHAADLEIRARATRLSLLDDPRAR
ncbi:MAG: aspartate carbamoyltransferase [Myxococcales bacterium FL481]|nr:MAG: aspartate carbamoyltransferase [Myxococcales bacterium FL481]